MSEGFTIINPDRNRLALIMAKHGLEAIKRGFRMNRAATPTRCKEIIEKATGKTFKRGQHDEMIAAAQEVIDEMANERSDQTKETGNEPQSDAPLT